MTKRLPIYLSFEEVVEIIDAARLADFEGFAIDPEIYDALMDLADAFAE